jgi:2-polyprenyl-6-methoxyphenol hydroxylase-like FAD-dependent oxidoreductase
MPNSSRRVAVPGLAFVGDAAMTADPLWAVGCGWAFQSAAWLVDCSTAALVSGKQDLDRALARYRRKHRSELFGFYFQSSNFSTARRLLPHEKLILSSAAKDPVMARRFTAFGEGLIGLGELLSPRSLCRAVRVVVSDRISRHPDAPSVTAAR